MFCNKEHLTEEGFLKAVSFINCLNRPLEAETSESVTSIYGALPELKLTPVIKYTSIDIPNPWWIEGFVSFNTILENECAENIIKEMKTTIIACQLQQPLTDCLT